MKKLKIILLLKTVTFAHSVYSMTSEPPISPVYTSSHSAPTRPFPLIKADEIIKESGYNKIILSSNKITGFFLEYSLDGRYLTLKHMEEDATVTEIKKIITPGIAGKVLFKANFFKDSFVSFHFGKPNISIFNDGEWTDEQHQQSYLDVDFLIWDVYNPDKAAAFFKIENPDFYSITIINDNNFSYTNNILVYEYLYKILHHFLLSICIDIS
jgi:hypothetical protein